MPHAGRGGGPVQGLSPESVHDGPGERQVAVSEAAMASDAWRWQARLADTGHCRHFPSTVGGRRKIGSASGKLGPRRLIQPHDPGKWAGP